MTNLSLFPELENVQCEKARRHSIDRNGEYVFQCVHRAFHPGPCYHRWTINPVPETEHADTKPAA